MKVPITLIVIPTMPATSAADAADVARTVEKIANAAALAGTELGHEVFSGSAGYHARLRDVVEKPEGYPAPETVLGDPGDLAARLEAKARSLIDPLDRRTLSATEVTVLADASIAISRLWAVVYVADPSLVELEMEKLMATLTRADFAAVRAVLAAAMLQALAAYRKMEVSRAE